MSIVRENLLSDENYTPYCGNMDCHLSMPRTKFNGSQFFCGCGWESDFYDDFIDEYKTKWESEMQQTSEYKHKDEETNAYASVFYANQPFVRRYPKTGRNEPCPCDSGKKYKRCCMNGESE